jgi:hypothetical protein
MSEVILNKIKQWLIEEVLDNQDVVDAKNNNDDYITSDGTDDIIYGRHECAECLLEQIELWENELDKEIEARKKLNLN